MANPKQQSARITGVFKQIYIYNPPTFYAESPSEKMGEYFTFFIQNVILIGYQRPVIKKGSRNGTEREKKGGGEEEEEKSNSLSSPLLRKISPIFSLLFSK